jgi:hypothetical protein
VDDRRVDQDRTLIAISGNKRIAQPRSVSLCNPSPGIGVPLRVTNGLARSNLFRGDVANASRFEQ